jgi:hypothetical protein
MKLTTIATIVLLAAAPAFATGGNTGGNSSSTATAIAGGGTAIATGGNATQGQIQGQTSTNSVNVEGTAVAPGVSCPFGFSFGTVGASAGLCIPTVTGNSVAVANAYIAAGRPDLAVVILGNTPVARRALRNAPAQPVAASPYLECDCVDKQRRIMRVVRAPGFTQEQANAACAATMR